MPTVVITTFRDARDVIPASMRLPLSALPRFLAPEKPPVRADVTGYLDRSCDLIDQAREAVLGLRNAARFQNVDVYRDLEKVAYKARGEDLADEEITARVEARVVQLKDGARRRAKLQLACWSPTSYCRHETRGADGVECVTCVVLDYDDGTPLADAIEVWEGCYLLAHPSWSHTPDHPRFRVILPLLEPVPSDAWPQVWAWARERSGGHIDEACKDPSRLYLLPAKPTFTAPYRALVRHQEGPLLTLDLDDLPLLPPSPGRRTGTERVVLPADKARLVARYRLRNSREVRERAARWLDAHLAGGRAERIACPSCGRPSVWFWIEPGRMSTAQCDHRNSCGWWGHIDEILDARGISHDR